MVRSREGVRERVRVGEDGTVKVELLHIDYCPSWEEAGARLRTALDAVGKADVDIRYLLLTTPEEAAKHTFAGSPTILIDGRDPFPSEGVIDTLACRVYATDAGLAGSPTVEQLVEALRESD